MRTWITARRRSPIDEESEIDTGDEVEGELESSCGSRIDLIQRSEATEDILDVPHLDRTALEVAAGPGLVRDEPADEKHLLAVLKREARLHLRA